MSVKWAMVLVACAVLAAMAVAYAAGQAKAAAPKVVRAQRFEVVDAEGRVRGEIGLGTDGHTPGLMFCNDKGKVCAMLVVSPDGSSSLMLSDAKGGTRGALMVGSDGRPNLWLYDGNAKGKLRAALSVGSDGQPSLGLYDAKGELRAALGTDSGGRPSLGLADEQGKPRAVLGALALKTIGTGAVEQRAESSLVLFDKEGKVLWQAR
jgi:hypothetical protein